MTDTNPAINPAEQPQQKQPTVSSIACRTITAKPHPTVMRMGPPATLRNWKFHKPLLAVGSTSGTVQIFNLATGKLYRELSVHSYSVSGIEWIGLNAFISYAVSESFQGNNYNWELHVTELDTGRTVQLRNGKSGESSVIISLKASHLRQYFIVVYKDNPFEIWDLETLSLLRRVPKKFSDIIAAEWSPLYSKRIEPSQAKLKDDAALKSLPTSAPLKENFVVTNRQGELIHFSIAGTVVKEISKIPPDPGSSKAVTAITWKSDLVVLGQSDGNLSVWDLTQKKSVTVSTSRSSIKRIRFAPGRGNMKILILYEDGVDVWDARRLRQLSRIITHRGHGPKVNDADWGASDRPVILTSNEMVVVTGIELKQLSDVSQEGLGSPNSPSMSQSHSNETCYLQ